MKDQCQFIIGCHCARDYKHLARTVGYALKCSPFEGEIDSDGGSGRFRARFVQIEPEFRGNVNNLEKEMREGYRMCTDLRDVVLERVHLVPLIMDGETDGDGETEGEGDEGDNNDNESSSSVSSSSLQDDIEGEVGGYVKYEHIESSKYSALVSYHDQKYFGSNGQYFFPSEQARAERALASEEQARRMADLEAKANGYAKAAAMAARKKEDDKENLKMNLELEKQKELEKEAMILEAKMEVERKIREEKIKREMEEVERLERKKAEGGLVMSCVMFMLCYVMVYIVTTCGIMV